mmetsp:Transcript_28678/g.73618  ORF Transcript_28678/g.73618 Transcript_28678/m.73618 type:complete len:421 (-) Transcript_28678:413-1675(-)
MSFLSVKRSKRLMACSTLATPLAASLRRMLTISEAVRKVSIVTDMMGSGMLSMDCSTLSTALSSSWPPVTRMPDTAGKPRAWMAASTPRMTSPRPQCTITITPVPFSRSLVSSCSMCSVATSMLDIGTRSSAACPKRTRAPSAATTSAMLTSAMRRDLGMRPSGGKLRFTSEACSASRSVSVGSRFTMTPFTFMDESTELSILITLSFTCGARVSSGTLPTIIMGRPSAAAIFLCQAMPTEGCPITRMKSMPVPRSASNFSITRSSRSTSLPSFMYSYALLIFSPISFSRGTLSQCMTFCMMASTGSSSSLVSYGLSSSSKGRKGTIHSGSSLPAPSSTPTMPIAAVVTPQPSASGARYTFPIPPRAAPWRTAIPVDASSAAISPAASTACVAISPSSSARTITTRVREKVLSRKAQPEC